MNQRIYKYLEYIVTTAHGNTMPDVLKEKIISDLALQVENRISVTLLEPLSPADQIAYNYLLEQKPDNEAVMAFFTQRLPNAQEIIQTVLADFEQEYISYMKPS